MKRGEPEPIKVASIGMGLQAWRHHVAMDRMEGVEWVGGVSRSGIGHPGNPEQGPPVNWGRTFGKRHEKDRGYIDRMLDTLQPDLVIVSVLPDQHGTRERGDSIEQLLVDRRQPFMVDKPLHVDAMTPAETAAAVEDAQLFAGAMYQYRASQITEAAREFLQEHPADPEEEVVMRYYSGGLYDPGIPRWWMYSQTSGRPVVEQVAHVLDQSRYLLGEVASVDHAEAAHFNPPELVQRWRELGIAPADIPTETTAELTFASGIRGRLETTAIQAEGKPRIEIVIPCEGGRTLTWSRHELNILEPGKSVRLGAEDKDFVWNPIRRLDALVIQGLREGDPTLLPSPYADARKTHDLSVAIRENAKQVPRVVFRS